jgi:hypothetical protein
LGGVAIIENQLHETAKLAVLTADEFEAEEAKLFAEAKALMPRLPFDDIDLLIVDRIGKNISGAGMDPNITGRWVHGYSSLLGGKSQSAPVVRRLLVRELTPESHGNAIGIGLADVTTTRLVQAMDKRATYINALTADATTANDTTANASLPGSALSTSVTPSSAGGRAVGLNTPPAMFANGTVGAGGPYDGIVTLNSGAAFQFTRPTGVGNFDALRSTQHEMDEVLGLGSYLNVPAATNVRPQDLFSWSAPSTRNITSTGSRYFSINSGNTNIVGFPIFTDARNQWGWTAGAGLEYAFAPQWSFKTEYLYIDLGSRTLLSSAINDVANGFTANAGIDVDAKLIDLQSSRDVRVAFGVDVGIHPDCDPGGPPEAFGDRLNSGQLAGRFNIDRFQPERHCALELAV